MRRSANEDNHEVVSPLVKLILQMNTGFVLEGFPSMGAWTTYALGTQNQDLPAFVAIPDMRGLPPNGPANWSAGFLPAAYQGTSFNSDHAIENLKSPAGSTSTLIGRLVVGILDLKTPLPSLSLKWV